MTGFADSPEARAFIESAESRNTDSRIMQTIVGYSRLLADAESIWFVG